MEFKNKVFRWDNEGVEPSESLKSEGFKGGYRPPAEVFNRFWSSVSKAIEELQNSVSSSVGTKVDATGTGKLIEVTTDEDVTDGTQLNVKLPADLEDNAKITINDGSQIPIKNPDGTPVKGGQKAGTYLNIIYSEADKCFYLVNGTSGESLTVKTVQSVLQATKWQDKKYSFEDEYPSSEYSLVIALSKSSTSAEYKAYYNAMMLSSADDNVVTAFGEVPTIDIPIVIQYMAASSEPAPTAQGNTFNIKLTDNDTGYYVEADDKDHNMDDVVKTENELTQGKYNFKLL